MINDFSLAAKPPAMITVFGLSLHRMIEYRTLVRGDMCQTRRMLPEVAVCVIIAQLLEVGHLMRLAETMRRCQVPTGRHI